ncbi:2-(3-amino-3-carboxypropyl)histidine synthase subunit 2-like [Mizuhopecten yessoensis]|uniref:2-(3-amino-3-carboxypropyl)histidine synthase subunit 2 n=1 Tax=Mizuhopecten yessoensis TaxID=6573 RepID=A0A210PEJ6_MIZYE|nr:2-(3-amino-3-carboxypropyl)histidine synthase subunit 2-like [Mizuhopecten yessoensis]XP_021343551.1 2-(3-amino-3-carboxypropyl)histidine synthase subunit 2-like [Mizuhopecten yessoensis]XP_021343552.1 2-(3-amino-3-carboxypropyl)histidine synthase subunit 2-like [Mizuhopecten yessoensis]XP_021343553.1 2-(3-amino-3-carboxypropyl)histidine synthase subunit 2-like [Mizuhopecten yessoensis]OWF34913.1 Diphthamide biosynthesis protein 2 [Mizuhopecten yessoensis]
MSTTTFFSADEVSLERKADADVETCVRTADGDINKVYEVNKCIQWIQERNLQRVALQFPDELMCDAVPVTSAISKAVDGQVFILGDTSYGSCCVDEVAAQHYNADGLIHFGRSCLSTTQRLPILYVFGQSSISVADCEGKFRELFPDTANPIVLLYETGYSHAIDKIKEALEGDYQKLVVSVLDIPNHCRTDLQGQGDCTTCKRQGFKVTKCGRTFWLPEEGTLSNYSMFYIGCESLTLTNLMMTFNTNQFYSYNPLTQTGRKESVNINRKLMKRFYMIEKAKDAHILGIVVGTLGITDYLQVIIRLKDMVKKSGKKSYTFVVGKLNPAKLANFMEIDVFVLVACAENSLLDSSDFYKPIVTPYELEIACNTDREWTADYVTDFRSLLPGGEDHVAIPVTLAVQTDVSLVTGKLRTIGVTEDIDVTSTAMLPRNQNMAVSEVPADTAGEYLASRSWRGLEQQLGETEVTKALEGQKGIAAGYTNELDTGS